MTIVASEVALDAMCKVALAVLPPQSRRTVVVYGSFGRHQQTSSSDLDVLFVGEKSLGAMESLTSALIEFSRRHGLPLDEEVPYANKLLADWDELTAASSCEMFIGQPRLTPVRRADREYLASTYMRRRLFVTGVLAQRTLAWSEDAQLLGRLRRRAGDGLVRAAIDDLQSRGAVLDAESVISYLTGEMDGIPADDWLGFEPDPRTRHHLRIHVERAMSSPQPSPPLDEPRRRAS